MDNDIISTEDGLVFNPYNNQNIDISKKDIETILKIHGVNSEIFNIKLYKRAFIHKSYTKRPDIENMQSNITISKKPDDCLRLKTKSNERLEFIGDGVLELITKYYLYKRFPKADEGFMTEKKIALVKNEHIGKLAYDIGLHKWLQISKHAEDKKIRTNLKKLGCLFEAFIGALFLDFNKISVKDEHKWFESVFTCGPGFQMCQIFIETIFEKYVDWQQLVKTDDNYKNILQVAVQKHFKTTPYYIEIDNDPDTGYNMGVYIGINMNPGELSHNNSIEFDKFGNFANISKYLHTHDSVLVFLASAKHKIKKKAEQRACENALQII